MSADKEMIDMLERDNDDLRAQLAACEKERDEARADYAACAAAAGIEYVQDQGPSYPGPVDAVVAAIQSDKRAAYMFVDAEARRDDAEARNAQFVALLRRVEHVKLPCMRFSRCPVCLSPLDLSQPHEDDCELAAALKGET